MNDSELRGYPQLDARLVSSGVLPSSAVSMHRGPAPLPERILQFGEGNFLRGFVDWLVERMNVQGRFGGRVVVVQPRPGGTVASLAAQDCLYTVALRGMEQGRVVDSREMISSISRCVNPFDDFEGFLACARQPDLRFVVSNTTEAGIQLEADDRLDARPAHSFPAKLTQLLYERYRHFNGDPARGVVLLPCELIERNGDALMRAVRETSERWSLSQEFGRWLGEACVVTNTLVDRIVSGFPKDEFAQWTQSLGYRDSQLVVAEPYHCWVIESPKPLGDVLPMVQAGLRVVWTSDLGPYRQRKVRVLNGAHTMVALAAYLAGKDTVGEVMADPLWRQFVVEGIEGEILPTLALPRAGLVDFARSVVERFQNPFLRHRLLGISLNSVSKYKARILDTVVDGLRMRNAFPPRLTFALAALIVFYRGKKQDDGHWQGMRNGAPYPIQDAPEVLEHLGAAWERCCPDGTAGAPAACRELARCVLSSADLWGQDLVALLPGFDQAVAEHLQVIGEVGIRAAIEPMVGRTRLNASEVS